MKKNKNIRKDLENKLEEVHQSQDKLTTQKKEIIELAEHFLKVLQN